ncbi:DNA mismatch repair protein MutS2-like [Arabidopsis thaliana]|uniref:DNA mismatch repair protein MutS2-like n=1 Tax=Arabidopsis thaliana TaxID=3702 RepID=Q9LVW1_ARATH|nr:DNA mismatch repair protein MutS2-like [Arabidopsis thaliana]
MQTLSIAFCNSALVIRRRNSIGNRNRVKLSLISSSSPTLVCHSKSKSQTDSLRVLEWDKLCDVVASFARTSLGREATKKKLWSLDQSFSESLKLLDETDAAIKMLEHGSFCLDLSSIHISLVESGIRHAKRRLSLRADQALEVASLLRFFENLQLDLKAAIKQDGDWYKRFMPLSELIVHPVINRSFVKLVEQVIDPDGTIKDSASSALRQSRERVQTLERKLQQLLDAIIRSQKDDESVMIKFQLAAEIDGRWCIQMSSNQLTSVNGLLLSSVYFQVLSLEDNMCFSGSGGGTAAEPIAAVSMNDDLQSARASVAKAEAEILSMLTEKINARATYSRAYGGAHPDIYLPPEDEVESLSAGENSPDINLPSEKPLSKKEWLLYLPRCYHPLLLYQHKKGIRKTRETVKFHKTADTVLSGAPPIPADFQISKGTRVLVITGPNTGGKTICLKSVGLAAMMAKSGLYVLATESARIPWFDNIYADIGDEQSLLQSLSTFSGHLKQISEILSHSTSRSLVLLDEVGAGTNPLEGAALGMAILESFAESGSLLTMATTHHGELKTLKYSNSAFENACMEFDDLNLKPTYKILWGVPGRSNAINIADRLGLPCDIIESARELYGSASAEINEVILDMERYKQEYQRLLNESRVYIRLSRELHENLLTAQKNINDHSTKERRKMRQELTQAGSMTRSTLRRTLQQFRSSAGKSSQSKVATQLQTKVKTTKDEDNGIRSSSVVERRPLPEAAAQKVPEVGSSVFVSSLGKKATVLKVEHSKKEILVQVGIMKMKVKLTDVVA